MRKAGERRQVSRAAKGGHVLNQKRDRQRRRLLAGCGDEGRSGAVGGRKIAGENEWVERRWE